MTVWAEDDLRTALQERGYMLTYFRTEEPPTVRATRMVDDWCAFAPTPEKLFERIETYEREGPAPMNENAVRAALDQALAAGRVNRARGTSNFWIEIPLREWERLVLTINPLPPAWSRSHVNRDPGDETAEN